MRVFALVVLLAACAKQEPAEIDADVVIRVSAEGTVHWNGERVRLADVAARLRKLESDDECVVDTGRDTDWAHVQWVLALWRNTTPGPAVVTLDRRDPVPIRDQYGYPDPMIFGGLTIEMKRSDRGETLYTLGQRSTSRAQQFRYWISEAATMLADWGMLTVDVAGDVPYGEVHSVFEMISAFDHVQLEVAAEIPHPWVMLQESLPRSTGIVHRWRSVGFAQKDLAPISLPLALAGQQDRDDDPDDRVILNIDAEGRILYKGKPILVEQLAQNLRDARRTYHRIKRMMRPNDPHAGEIQYGEGKYASRLYVLLRADQDAPWRSVEEVLETLHDGEFHAIQLATQRYATLDHAPEDAERVGVERIEIAPSGLPELERKILCFQKLNPPNEQEERYIEVEIPSDGLFRIGPITTRNLEQLAKRIREDYHSDRDRERSVCGRVRARPDTRYQDVVSVVDAFNRAGLERVDLR